MHVSNIIFYIFEFILKIRGIFFAVIGTLRFEVLLIGLYLFWNHRLNLDHRIFYIMNPLSFYYFIFLSSNNVCLSMPNLLFLCLLRIIRYRLNNFMIILFLVIFGLVDHYKCQLVSNLWELMKAEGLKVRIMIMII